MFSTLPDLVDPWRAAESSAIFAGRLPLSALPRLRALLIDTAGDVVYRLAFFRDSGERAVVIGDVDACLSLRCQRCLKAMEHRVNARVELALVAGLDEVERLPDSHDPLLVTDHLIRPLDLIEDELLLGLPQIPRHEPGICRAEVECLSSPAPATNGGEMNPFAALAALKRERNN